VVVVVDYAHHWLDLRWIGNGTRWKHLGSRGNEPGQFNCPWAVAVTRAGALVVTMNTILKSAVNLIENKRNLFEMLAYI
jgi:hypothetical protein